LSKITREDEAINPAPISFEFLPIAKVFLMYLLNFMFLNDISSITQDDSLPMLYFVRFISSDSDQVLSGWFIQAKVAGADLRVVTTMVLDVNGHSGKPQYSLALN
jgi:hypothetical protein